MMTAEKTSFIYVEMYQDGSNQGWRAMFSVIETSVILLIYSIFLGATYFKIRFRHLGFQEHCTMWVFFVAEVFNLAAFIWILLTRQYEFGQLVDAILIAFINVVLLYYLYQMQIVKIKLESEDHASYTK